MDYTPVEPTLDMNEAIFEAPPGASWTRFPKRHRTHTESSVLRYRGLAFDLTADAVLLHERQVRLAAAERDLLKALMRRAGQIMSAVWLADQLGVTVAEIEACARSLAMTLTEAGAPCLPRRVDGLGYILWR